MAFTLVNLRPVSERAPEIVRQIDERIGVTHAFDPTYAVWTFHDKSFEEAKDIVYDALAEFDPEQQHLRILEGN